MTLFAETSHSRLWTDEEYLPTTDSSLDALPLCCMFERNIASPGTLTGGIAFRPHTSGQWRDFCGPMLVVHVTADDDGDALSGAIPARDLCIDAKTWSLAFIPRSVRLHRSSSAAYTLLGCCNAPEACSCTKISVCHESHQTITGLIITDPMHGGQTLPHSRTAKRLSKPHQT